MRRKPWLSVMVGTGLLVTVPTSASADGVSGQAEGSSLTVAAEREVAREAGRGQREQARSVAIGPVPITTLVIACQGNGPGTLAQTSLFCEASRLGCDDTPDPNDIMYWRWPGTRTPDGSVTHGLGPAGTVCLGPDEAATVEVPELTLADFRNLPLPPGTAIVQPAGGRVLINVPTNVYVAAGPVTLDTTLLGLPVAVRATQTEYTWDFADGNPLTTTDPGAPYPEMRTTHTYVSSGDYTISLTTAYAGEYSVAGGPWIPVDGTATVTSPPIALTALSGHNELVADPLTG